MVRTYNGSERCVLVRPWRKPISGPEGLATVAGDGQWGFATRGYRESRVRRTAARPRKHVNRLASNWELARLQIGVTKSSDERAAIEKARRKRRREGQRLRRQRRRARLAAHPA